MKAYYLLTKTKNDIFISRCDTKSVRRINIPASIKEEDFDLLDADSMRRFLSLLTLDKHDGWLVSYPHTTEAAAQDYERALKKAGFTAPVAISDLDILNEVYNKNDQEQKYFRSISIIIDKDNVRMQLYANDQNLFHSFSPNPPDGIGRSFSDIPTPMRSVNSIIIAGDHPSFGVIEDAYRKVYSCKISTDRKDDAVHSGLETICQNILIANALLSCWSKHRTGAKNLPGAIYERYHKNILAPIDELLTVSDLYDSSLAYWKAGFIRYKDVSIHMLRNMEKLFEEETPQKLSRALSDFCIEYADTVNRMLRIAANKAGEEFFSKHIGYLKDDKLLQNILQYLNFYTKDALTRACMSVTNAYVEDHTAIIDIPSGHRTRLLNEKADIFNNAKHICDTIAKENYANIYTPDEKRRLLAEFILTAIQDTDKQVIDILTKYISKNSLFINRAKKMLHLDIDVIIDDINAIEQGAAAGLNINWVEEEPAPTNENPYGDDYQGHIS
ncbi:MAG: hypothetical protein E7334_11380 [Clostridiales bacterium]|nr:hypothetical protein [Clostridiales bacterium]